MQYSGYQLLLIAPRMPYITLSNFLKIFHQDLRVENWVCGQDYHLYTLDIQENTYLIIHFWM